jgi:hypothetical protein
MKYLLYIGMMSMMVLKALGQNMPVPPESQDTLIRANAYPYAPAEGKYCVQEMGTRAAVFLDEKTVARSVKLENGTTLTPYGILIKKDNTHIILKEGECVDKAGNITRKMELPKKP